MTTTNPALLSVPIAENGNKNTIPATQAAAGNGLMSQSTGFPPETALPLGAGGVAPSREDMNGAFNLLGGVAFYAQKGWTFHYDATQAYFKGCIVIDPADDKRYECIADMAVDDTIAPHSDTNNTYWKEFSLGGGVPVGFIMPYAGTGLAEGFLDCDGSAVSRTMYPDLFEAIGTTWGAGDGSTTFNLPRSEDLMLQGASTTNPVGTYKTAGLPNIEGDNIKFRTINNGQNSIIISSGNGAFSTEYVTNSSSQFNLYQSGSSSNTYDLTFDASLSNPIYGNSNTVQPPAACVRFMIKAFDGATPSSAGIDLTQYAQDLANRLTREMTPAFNKRDVVTTSGTYTAHVTGWYKITVKGGGGGGTSASTSGSTRVSGNGGGEGGTTIAYEKMTEGDTAAVIVGAGGSANSNGGNSTVTVNNNTYVGGGGFTWGSDITDRGKGGGGTIAGNPGGAGAITTNSVQVNGGAGGGNGGAASYSYNGVDGGGGAGATIASSGSVSAASSGGDGFVWFEYFDPSLN